jgi:hypothetical protein
MPVLASRLSRVGREGYPQSGGAASAILEGVKSGNQIGSQDYQDVLAQAV